LSEGQGVVAADAFMRLKRKKGYHREQSNREKHLIKLPSVFPGDILLAG